MFWRYIRILEAAARVGNMAGAGPSSRWLVVGRQFARRHDGSRDGRYPMGICNATIRSSSSPTRTTLRPVVVVGAQLAKVFGRYRARKTGMRDFNRAKARHCSRRIRCGIKPTSGSSLPRAREIRSIKPCARGACGKGVRFRTKVEGNVPNCAVFNPARRVLSACNPPVPPARCQCLPKPSSPNLGRLSPIDGKRPIFLVRQFH
ncbi:MAG: hypothetical protein JWQ19_3997 [Subtercola sp.]|nr:hypothetical protein [Subtercola sp.]